MSLKNLPIRYAGELHDIRLVNFSVDKDEVLPLLPKELRLRLIHDRALISMVDVKLKRMHPTFLPAFANFAYRHIAFRLLVDDSQYTGACKGIHFLRSFTDKAWIALGGSLFTHYKLTSANIREKSGVLRLSQGDRYLEYSLNGGAEAQPWLKETVGQLDRAYFVDGGQVQAIQIQRERWPLEGVNCPYFETNYFKTAKLEGAFKVKEIIPYIWLPPKKVEI